MKSRNRCIQTFLGQQTRLEGKLVFEGTVRMDGHFAGTIESRDGMVVIGERGVVEADLFVRAAIVSGEVRGNINATERIELHPPARINGDLKAPTLVIEPGVSFYGQCLMKPEEAIISLNKMQVPVEQKTPSNQSHKD